VSILTSTPSLAGALRQSILDVQNDLVRAQREVSTGRQADLGVSLGLEVGRDVSLAVTGRDLSAIANTNNIVSTRLATTQSALTSLQTTASSIRASLLSALNQTGNLGGVATDARIALGNLISTLNTTDGNSFVFSGLNSDAAPINAYVDQPPSATKQAVDAAFQSAFGFPQTDPNVSAITASQIQNYLTGPYDSLFTPTAWRTDWSKASDTPLTDRISVSQTTATSVSANSAPFIELAKAYTALGSIGLDKLDKSASAAAVSLIEKQVDDAITGIIALQTNVGVTQKNVDNANQTISIQQSVLQTQIGTLENVDPAEAATRVSNLTTQLETAYTLTSKIGQLSLMKYL
jgi:flagellar hook-associated protein 3 FlgL